MAALDGDGIARLHGSRSIHEGISGEAASFTFPWPVPAGFPAWAHWTPCVSTSHYVLTETQHRYWRREK